VSGVIRNPKGLRRSIGLEWGRPLMNRSAKDGIRSSPHYRGEGVTHSPIAPRCLLAARYGRFMRDPRRPVGVLVLNQVSDPIPASNFKPHWALLLLPFRMFSGSWLMMKRATI
jgi:hypothetical protein